MSQLTTQSPQALSDTPRVRVMRSLRQMIDEGVIGRGEPIPSARVLSNHLSVDRRTVGHAIKMLVDEGVLADRDGNRGEVIVPAEQKPLAGVLQNAVVVVDPTCGEAMNHHRSGWASAITDSAIREIHRRHLHVLSIHPYRADQQEIGRVLSGHPYGVLVPEITDQLKDVRSWVSSLEPSGSRMVVYGDWPEMQGYDRVISDHEAGAYELTQWLLAQGRKRIQTTWALDAGGYWLSHRRAGYERAMREAGLEPLPPADFPKFPMGGYSSNEGFKDMTRYVAGYLMDVLNGFEPADALMLETDGHYFATAAACRKLGKEPGKDLAIVGYDDYWSESPERAMEPSSPAATVDKQNEDIGREMVNLLVDRVEGRLPDEPQCRVVRPRMIVTEQND